MFNWKHSRDVLLAFCTFMCTATLYFVVMTEARISEAVKRHNLLEADIQNLRDDRDALIDAVKSTSDIAVNASQRTTVLEAKQVIRETTGGP